MLAYTFIGIFLASASSASLLPGWGELVVMAAIALDLDLTMIIIASTLGSYVGASINYFIGWGLGLTIIKRFVSKERVKQAKFGFKKYGSYLLFFSWVPIIGDPLTAVAGILKYDFKKFTIFVLPGKFVKALLLIALVKYLPGVMYQIYYLF